MTNTGRGTVGARAALSVAAALLGLLFAGAGCQKNNKNPAVGSVTPALGPTAGGTRVIIAGKNFYSPVTVKFAGVDASAVTVVGRNQIACDTPPHASGSFEVSVTTSHGTAARLNAFRYLGEPAITSVTPGQGPFAGGTPVTITGTDFYETATVDFGAGRATEVAVVDPNTITCVAPPYQPGDPVGAVGAGVAAAAGVGATPAPQAPAADGPVAPAAQIAGSPLVFATNSRQAFEGEDQEDPDGFVDVAEAAAPVAEDAVGAPAAIAASTDAAPPSISAFDVTPGSATLGGAFEISYTVSDCGGAGLKQVELWRSERSGSALDPTWRRIATHSLSGDGPVSGSFTDAPSAARRCWYGILVTDGAVPGNAGDERQAGIGPIQVTVPGGSAGGPGAGPPVILSTCETHNPRQSAKPAAGSRGAAGPSATARPRAASATGVEAAGTVQFEQDTYVFDEDAGEVTVRVTRTGGTDGAGWVYCRSIGGTAEEGWDYDFWTAWWSGADSYLLWTDGDPNAKFVHIFIYDDSVHRGDRSFALYLEDGGGVGLGAPSLAVITIREDDPATVQFGSPAYDEYEDAGQVRLLVSRTGEEPLSVRYETADGTARDGVDYSAVSGVLTWAAGDTNDKEVFVPLINNALQDGSRSFMAKLSQPVGADPGEPWWATVTIKDDDEPPFPGAVQFEDAAYTVREGLGTVRLLVTRTGGSFGQASVRYHTADGTAGAADYTAVASGLLTWPDGDSSPKRIDITIANDTVPENDEQFVVYLDTPIGVSLGSPTLAVVTIEDDDLPTVQFRSATYTVREDDGSVRLWVSRTGTDPVSVTYATVDGSAVAGTDYSAAGGTLSWAAGDTDDKPIDVPIIDDAIYRGSRIFSVDLIAAVDGDLGTPSSATVTITDDDAVPPGTIRFKFASQTAAESAGTVKIWLTRAGGHRGVATVDYTTADGTATAGADYGFVAGTITWADGEEGDKSFDVTITNDSLYESNEVFFAYLSGASGASLGSPTFIPVTIMDSTGGRALVNVRVTTPYGSAVAVNAYEYIGAPTLVGVLPSSGPADGGTPVTIVGGGFYGPATVSFGGASAASAVVVSRSMLTCTSPAHAPGLVDVAVTTPFGGVSGPELYEYLAVSAAPVAAEPAEEFGADEEEVAEMREARRMSVAAETDLAADSASRTETLRAAPAGKESSASCATTTREETVQEEVVVSDVGSPQFSAPPNANPSPGVVNRLISFTCGVNDPGGGYPVNVAWDFGDGQAASGESVTHTYRRAGAYQVSVTATNSRGRGRTARVMPPVVIRSACGQFNSDADTDILWCDANTGKVCVWEMNGPSKTAETAAGDEDRWLRRIVGSGDFNLDGKADCVLRDQDGGVCIRFMDGTAPGAIYSLGCVSLLLYDVVGCADPNGDGAADVLFRRRTDGAVYAWLVEGGASPRVSAVVRLGWAGYPAWELAGGAGDFDGDGGADLVWRERTGLTRAYAWVMNGAAVGGIAWIGEAPANWRFGSVGDYRGGGGCDIVWRDHATGRNLLWKVDGTTLIGMIQLEAKAGANWMIVGPR